MQLDPGAHTAAFGFVLKTGCDMTSSTVAPERFTVELHHIFVDVLDRIMSSAERLSFVLLFA